MEGQPQAKSLAQRLQQSGLLRLQVRCRLRRKDEMGQHDLHPRPRVLPGWQSLPTQQPLLQQFHKLSGDAQDLGRRGQQPRNAQLAGRTDPPVNGMQNLRKRNIASRRGKGQTGSLQSRVIQCLHGCTHEACLSRKRVRHCQNTFGYRSWPSREREGEPVSDQGCGEAQHVPLLETPGPQQ